MIASAEISESLTQFDDWKQRIAEAAGLEAAVPQEEGIDASMDALEIIPLKQRLDEFCSFFEETRSISQRLHENRQRRDALTNGISELSVALERIERDLHQLEAERVKLRLFELNQAGELTELETRAGVVKSEASSEHWLAANWRPITMLTFTALIVARWLGWAAPNLAEAEYLKLWDIVELGLGGYVIGRSAEKVLPQIAAVLKK
jgi:hypothetical protein